MIQIRTTVPNTANKLEANAQMYMHVICFHSHLYMIETYES